METSVENNLDIAKTSAAFAIVGHVIVSLNPTIQSGSSTSLTDPKVKEQLISICKAIRSTTPSFTVKLSVDFVKTPLSNQDLDEVIISLLDSGADQVREQKKKGDCDKIEFFKFF